MKPAVVLDASALLTALFAETGHERVTSLLGRAAISAVNYSEVLSRQIRMGASFQLATANLAGLNLRVIPWDHELAEAAADLSPLGWTHGLSLGDRACLATARKLGVTAVTADRNWGALPALGIHIEVIR